MTRLLAVRMALYVSIAMLGVLVKHFSGPALVAAETLNAGCVAALALLDRTFARATGVQG